MAKEITYDNIDRPYSTFMTRSEQESSAGSEAGGTSQDEGGRTIKSGSSLNDAWIDTWIKSTGYIPKKRGFLLDGQAGYIECMKLYVGGGGIVGGALDIPDLISANSFHVDASGNTWWGGTTLATSVASILNTGVGAFSNITITGGTIGGVTVANIGAGNNPTADSVPTGLTVSSTGVTISSTGTMVANVVLTWTAISSSTFDHYQIRFKIGTYTYYTYIDSKTNTITIDGLAPNVAYNFGIASVNKFGISSAFSADISSTTAKSTTAPATVAGVTATAGIQYVIVAWTSNTEADVVSYDIYRNTTNSSATASLIGNSFTNYFIDGGRTGGQIYYYFLKARNTSALTSASFSTVASATPRNVATSDVGVGQITAPLTSLSAINATDGTLNVNTVGTTQIVAGAVTSDKGNIAMRGWTQTSVFSVASSTQVNWGAGTFTASDGTAYSIGAGNTGAMSAKTYIYLNIAVSTTAYQTTTTAATAVGDGKVLVAIVQNNTTEATFSVLNNSSYNIDASNIVTGSITANEMAVGSITADKIFAGAVTANKITSSNFVVSAGTFTNNSPSAGKIAWTGCKVVYQGTEYSITDGNCLATDKHIYWQLASPTVFAVSATLPALGNDDFLVAFNNSGTVVVVWNSTIINGNRITTGSITATNMAANSITANAIEAGAVTANKITSNSFAFSAGTFTANSPGAGRVSWSGCKVVYQGTEYSITDGNCLATEKHIYWQLASPTIFSTSITLPSLGNDDFLVVFNNSGTPLYVWNSTIINGNRITTGSISATQIDTTSITSLTNLTIGASQVLIDGAVYLSNWRNGTDLTKIDGGNIYVGSSITLGASSPAPISGHIKSGQTDYNTGIGWWIGAVAGVPKFSMGNPADSYLTYDSGTGLMTLKGAITATTGTIGSFTIGTYLYTGSKTAYNDANAGVHIGSDGIGIGNNLFTVSAAGVLNAVSGSVGGWSLSTAAIYKDTGADATSAGMAPADYPFYAGKQYASRATAPFRVTPAGALYASGVEVSGKIVTGTGSTINGTYIDSLDVSKLNAGTITSKIITLSYINGAGDVAINCGKTNFGDDATSGFILGVDDSDSNKVKFEIGSSATKILKYDGTDLTLIGGTITGSMLQTSASANTGVKIGTVGGDTGVLIYGDNLYIKDTAGNTAGYLGGASDNLHLTGTSGRYVQIGSYEDLILDAGSGWSVYPGKMFTDLGTSSHPWRENWFSRINFHTRNYVGVYDSLTTYYKDNRVLYSGGYWDYINATPTSGNTPAEDAYWTAQLSPSPYNLSEDITFDTGSTTTPTNFLFSSNIKLATGKDFKGDYAHIDNIVLANNSPLTENGSIYFDGTHFYGRIAGAWKQLDN